MDMNVTKETSQKQNTDMVTDTQTESIKNSEKTEHPGALSRPIGESPSETPSTDSADTKILTDNSKSSTKKMLTWIETLTAAIPNKLVEWAKHIFTQLCPWAEDNNMKWRMILYPGTCLCS